MDPSTRLQSPTREGCWLQISLVHPDDEDQEDAWLQNPTCTNTAISSQEQ